MGLIHERIHGLLHHSADPPGMPGPILDVGKEKVADSYRLQNIADSSRSDITGKLVALRTAYEGDEGFNGQKFQAFLNMLQYGCERGRTIVVVVPLSSSYLKEFITPELNNEFEAAITNAQHQYPKVKWLRLDQVAGSESDSNFCDIVHMNADADMKATAILGSWLNRLPH
jgi:hypothetical protein